MVGLPIPPKHENIHLFEEKYIVYSYKKCLFGRPSIIDQKRMGDFVSLSRFSQLCMLLYSSLYYCLMMRLTQSELGWISVRRSITHWHCNRQAWLLQYKEKNSFALPSLAYTRIWFEAGIRTLALNLAISCIRKLVQLGRIWFDRFIVLTNTEFLIKIQHIATTRVCVYFNVESDCGKYPFLFYLQGNMCFHRECYETNGTKIFHVQPWWLMRWHISYFHTIQSRNC